MDNFKVIYKILRYLETMMDVSEPDMSPITAESLGLSQERWANLMEMLIRNEYIEGASAKRYVRTPLMIINLERTRITLKGLEYLQENSLMKKAANIAKGITEIIT